MPNEHINAEKILKGSKMSGEATTMDLSIVIPAFNEEQNVKELIKELDSFVADFEESQRSCEVIFVDDGSQDRTYPMVKELAQNRPYLKTILLRRNFGQTAAMSAGFDFARGDVIVPMDADLQNDPADIHELLKTLEEGYDVVSGWRKDRQDTWLTRKLPSKLANMLVSWVGGVRLHDYGCTLKAYKKEVLKEIRLYGEMHRFIPIYASWSGAQVGEIPVNHRPRTAGESKYNLGRTFKVMMDLMTVKFLGGYSTKPLYLFGTLGTFLCVAGLICGVITLIQKFTIGAWVHKNPLLQLAVFLFTIGLILFFMGLQAELMVRTYHESQGKPTYLTKEVFSVKKEPNKEHDSGKGSVK